MIKNTNLKQTAKTNSIQIKIPIIFFKFVAYGGTKYYPQLFLDKIFYKN